MKKALKIAAWALLVLIGLFALLLWGFIELMSPDPHEYLETRGLSGQVAHLERPGGSMEPIYYSVKVDRGLKGECTAATLEGYEAERWVRLAWDDAALVVRYGLPANPEAKATVPVVATGSEACANLTVRITEDSSLIPTEFLGDRLAPSPADPPPFTQADADRIVAECGAPKGILRVEGDGLRLDSPMNLDYDVSACLLKAIKAAGVTKFGFVGNEKAPETEER